MLQAVGQSVVLLAGAGRASINGRWPSRSSAENFTSAIGTVIFVAYLSALCRNPLHTATQYALLTALAAVGRTYLSSGAGFVAKATGWPLFFAICVAGRDPEPDPARLAAAARTFRRAGDREGLAPRHCQRRRSNLTFASSRAPVAQAGIRSIPGRASINRMTVDVGLLRRWRSAIAGCSVTACSPRSICVTTASLICPASCEHATSSTLHRDFLADKVLQLRRPAHRCW